MAKSTSPSTTRKPLARSAACLSNRLHELVSACFSGLWITTAEPTEATRPTVVLDVDALLGSLVGQSESNVRAALKLADVTAPCVLFADEIEKALAGATSSKQARPDDTNWTGAEIKSCCRLASLLDVPLVQAAQNVVPVAVTAGAVTQEVVPNLR